VAGRPERGEISTEFLEVKIQSIATGVLSLLVKDAEEWSRLKMMDGFVVFMLLYREGQNQYDR
jgi:hypothetical protein